NPYTTGMLFIKALNSNGTDTYAYYHHDHLQTPIQATDKQGNVVWAASYNAFGQATIITPAPTVDKPTITSKLRLPGQYWDEETGLHQNYFRDYDPGTGRYTTSDPIGLKGGINTYTYVEGNPLSYTDPKGLFKFHGQWCGPNWTGGHEKPWDRLTGDERRKVKPPEDALDSCCEVHDKCHADCRAKFPCDMNQQKRCLESCDRRLNFCSRQSGIGSFPLEDYMRKSSPTPEKGACCPN
ncbi:MAG: RHS repeat-associated core domain-containing protein, partial [Sulfurimicrobium sp.]|nr:RHS repeat-associated core domain-containing protein [Sulfurimicrobium sp.]